MNSNIQSEVHGYRSADQLKSSSQMSFNQSGLVMDAMALLRAMRIRLVAFDFDCTLVSIHTGGQWPDSAEKLAEFVRPCFRDLLPELLKCSDIHTCVVTYSPQEELIRDVLRISMKEVTDVDLLISKIVIRGNSKDFLYMHGLEAYTNGKQLHLDFCRSHFDQTGQVPIENNGILLIDDDVTNLKMAQENNHFAFHVDNNVNLNELVCYLNNCVQGGTC
ncbi:ATP-binding Cassette (ABC) superfamily [Brachionus plicatilis]|uniref:ATP-binding Cassette (ABC) superfamily n=1 Tax=Brachionus plicatilis TaxID=10195 RepID=A0A3M7R841_BRAPC|nr:ATP-binding Cassette (ABC) superfamily [Brachionus plicatilis]